MFVLYVRPFNLGKGLSEDIENRIGIPLSPSCLLVSLPLPGFGLLTDALLDGNSEDRVSAEHTTGPPWHAIRV